MTSVVHIAETALLLLAAYLAGCVIGYAVHRILHAGRGTRQPTVAVTPIAVAPAAAPSSPKPPRTPAARLAAAHEPVEARPKLPKPELKPKSAPKPKRQPADPRPTALDAPRGGQADNLKQIKGIGPKIEASLNSLGIYHLDQIAAWTKANIDWIDGQLAFKGRIRREQWVEQATELTKAKVGA